MDIKKRVEKIRALGAACCHARALHHIILHGLPAHAAHILGMGRGKAGCLEIGGY